MAANLDNFGSRGGARERDHRIPPLLPSERCRAGFAPPNRLVGPVLTQGEQKPRRFSPGLRHIEPTRRRVGVEKKKSRPKGLRARGGNIAGRLHTRAAPSCRALPQRAPPPRFQRRSCTAPLPPASSASGSGTIGFPAPTTR